jgi:hypothetical protein
MLKPDSLRKALTDAAPVLAANPDMLRLYVDGGNIAATLATSLSFEKQYTLNVIVTDFTGDFDLILVPVLAWLREHQPDILSTDTGQKKVSLLRLILTVTAVSISASVCYSLSEHLLMRWVRRFMFVASRSHRCRSL